ncbi:MAG: prepilin peptidase [bacterium]
MLIFFLGTALGSFLNVCIYRLPKKESIIRPGSYCPNCKNSIPIWHNIPIFSYLILGGKCKNCKAKISFRYPLVEFLTGILLALLWEVYGLSLSFVQYSILILFLMPISFIDLDCKLILNALTLPGIIIALALALILKLTTIPQALTGLLLGGGFLWLVGLLGKFIFNKESMGAGDVKLGAMIGAFLGPQVVIALFLAFFLAFPLIAIGLSSGRLHLGSTLPFGPFISLGAVIMICFGQELLQIYFRLLEF